MNRLVIDGSIALSWFLPGESEDTAETVRGSIEAGATALVPSIWPLEIANALLAAERRKRINPTDSAAAWNALRRLPIEVDEETGARAGTEILTLARQQGLSAYDAAYLELAVRKNIPLATLDNRLRSAGRAVGIPVLPESSDALVDHLRREGA